MNINFIQEDTKMDKSIVTIRATLTIMMILATTAQAWIETFDGDPADLAWDWASVEPVGYSQSATFQAQRQQDTNGNYFVRLTESASVTSGGAAFGIGFVPEAFTDVRIGAVINVTEEACIYYQGLGARAFYFLHPAYGGLIADAYTLHVDWEDGPANISINIEKVYQLSNMMDQGIGAMVPGYAHRKSYYAVLDVIGSDPTFVTGCLYEYEGGPLLARTPTMVDTGDNDDWEDAGVNDAPFLAGPSGIFAQNERDDLSDPVGFDVTFDDISSTGAPSAAALSPADGATGVAIAPTLRWVAAGSATSTDVYFGPAGAMSIVASATTSSEYSPGTLQAGQTYNWRIDQNGPDGLVEGFTWSFTTIDSVIVDDFESYTDDNLWEAWDPNMSGSSAPDPNGLNYVETETVQHGDKAMRIEYRNQITPFRREYTRTFTTPQDWTIDGITTLTLAFRGQTDNARQLLYITLEDDNGTAASATIGDSCSIQTDGWNDADIDLTELADQGVDLKAVKKIIIGVGDGTPSDQPDDDIDTLYIDNIRLYQPRCFNSEQLNLSGDINNDCTVNLQDFAAMAANWLNNGLSIVP
jgi:hypothetical protein